MSLRIGRYIQFALGSNKKVSAAAKGGIFPVIAPMNRPVEPPYIVFAMSGVEESATKDGLAYDTVTEEILCFGTTLDECESLAELVRGAMMMAWRAWNANDGDFEIADQTLRVGNEDFDLNHEGFYVPLVYTIETTH